MKQYLYIYNYSPHEMNLCQMEVRRIFHDELTSKYYFSQQYFDHTRSVYIKGRLDIMESSSCFQDIIDYIHKNKLCFYDFKVMYLKNDITHVNYEETLEKCKAISYPIDGSVDFKDPKVLIGFTKINDIWYFGIYHTNLEWDLRSHKPHSYSHSLNVRDARTIVNIAVGNDLSLKVVDPCCGVGTVVLEALSMGIDIQGFDINRDVSYQARLNLEHFGYNPLVVQKRDMRTLEQKYDVAIMDIPYGVYSPFTQEQQIELIKGAHRLAKRLLLVCHDDMEDIVKNIGYHIVDKASIQKGSFIRYMILCEREM